MKKTINWLVILGLVFLNFGCGNQRIPFDISTLDSLSDLINTENIISFNKLDEIVSNEDFRILDIRSQVEKIKSPIANAVSLSKLSIFEEENILLLTSDSRTIALVSTDIMDSYVIAVLIKNLSPTKEIKIIGDIEKGSLDNAEFDYGIELKNAKDRIVERSIARENKLKNERLEEERIAKEKEAKENNRIMAIVRKLIKEMRPTAADVEAVVPVKVDAPKATPEPDEDEDDEDEGC